MYLMTLTILCFATFCGSRKYPCPQHRGSLEIPRGRGVLKAKIFKGTYEPKLEFPEGWGVKPKNPLWESMDIFWKNTLCSYYKTLSLSFVL